jgi:YD repeat-containing protein
LATGAIEIYTAQGVLDSVSVHGGQVVTLTYSDVNTPSNVAPTSGLLIGVTEHAPGTNSNFDVTLHLQYDAKWRITQMIDATGGVTSYSYDANNNLIAVTWPDGNVKRYVYADSRFTSALTSVIDEAGSIVGTWTYDNQGRAIAVSHPDTSRNVSLSYGGDGTRVNYGTNSLLMNFASIENMSRPTTTTSSAGAGSSSWDANGNLLGQTGISGAGRSVNYDSVGRPTRATHFGLSGKTVISVRYADDVTLHPSMIASPGWVRAFSYDTKANLIGFSEWSTSDKTGESGFAASADESQKISYGFAYDSTNQLYYAQVFDAGLLREAWSMSRDVTGNVRQMYNRSSGKYYSIPVRDRAHRPVMVAGPNDGLANFAYDIRGRVKSFWYDDPAANSNGNVHRFLKIELAYSPDGSLISRSGTVSTNNGADVVIDSDEMDLWISNYNEGVVPVGPPTNLLGWVKAFAESSEPPLVPILAPWEWGLAEMRYAMMIFQVMARDPAAILVEKLKPEIEAKSCVEVPQQLTAEEAAGLLREAASRKGNYTEASITITAEDAQILGEAWVGEGARLTSDGTGLVSANGLRVYRFPSSKPNNPLASTGTQANYIWKSSPTSKPIGNTHLNIAP